MKVVKIKTLPDISSLQNTITDKLILKYGLLFKTFTQTSDYKYKTKGYICKQIECRNGISIFKQPPTRKISHVSSTLFQFKSSFLHTHKH